MLSSNHVVAGGVIGLVCKRHPLAAVAVGFASHFALDALPHWGASSSEDFYRVARRDGVTGAVLLASTLVLAPRRARPALAGAMLASVAPDADMVLDYFFHRKIAPAWFTKAHVRVQQGRESGHRITQEVVSAGVGAAVLLLCVCGARRSQRA
jgi:hypothetical protein